MAGFGLLGHLAGGYVEAARQDRARQDMLDEQQRQMQIGLGSMILQNPAVPPEYKGPVMEHLVGVVNTPRGKKLPSWDKMMSSLPAVNTPAKTQNVQQPNLTLTPPQAPPGASQAPAEATTTPPAATRVQGSTAPMISSAGPGNANGIQPPAIPPGAGPSIQIPGGQTPVTLAPQQISPAGQFHVMSPQELAEQQNTIEMNRLAEVSRRTGMTIPELMGRPDLVSVPAFGSLYSRSQGDVVATGQGMGKVVATVPGSLNGVPTMVGRTAGGNLVPLTPGQDISGFVPTPVGILNSTVPTVTDTSSNYNVESGTTSTHRTSQKVIPGQAPVRPAGGGSSFSKAAEGKPGGRVATMAESWANLGQEPSVKDKPYVEKYMAANNMTPMPKMPPGERTKLTTAFTAVSEAQSRLNRMQDDLAQVQKNPDNAGSYDIDLLSQHIALTFGTVKGVRTGQALIEAHLKARSLPESMEVLAKKVLNGQQLSQAQRENFIHLANTTLAGKQREFGELKNQMIGTYGQQVGGGVTPPAKPPGVQPQQSAAHVIELNGKHYQYKGTGDTADINNYTEVKAQ